MRKCIGDPISMFWTTVIGLVAGVIARLVTPGRKGPFGFLLTALLGITGAFGSAYFGQEAGWFSAGDEGACECSIRSGACPLGLGYAVQKPTSDLINLAEQPLSWSQTIASSK